MRCLALADALRELGGNISFIHREVKGNLSGFIEGKGYAVYLLKGSFLPEGAEHGERITYNCKEDALQTINILERLMPVDWLVVDTYAQDILWEKYIRQYVKNIMVIHDLADREHDCDLLLDQNFYENMETRYEGLLPERCKTLIGPQYALLRGEFAEVRKRMKIRSGHVKRILVFFGGSDPANETLNVLKALRQLGRTDISVGIVIGRNNAHRQEIETEALSIPNAYCHYDVANMAELMLVSDLYIGSAGITTWERCCMGLPSLVITIAENQVRATEDMAEHNLLCYLGESGKIRQKTLVSEIDRFLSMPVLLEQYSVNSARLVDGLGAQRCAKIMANY